ncbi:hypothetical protein SAY86_017192 [Trapa natans]|uniref:Uncharacterized protein n=1 Tax=Trapa natans TaxID=22666 RepID=A0AAN7R8K6_TRANT|nr:hypothetical protein SAY86_017192 [Trapa natans]
MDSIQVKLISREIIKPSSPTPDHLKTFPLSLIDQLYPHVYTRMVLFYSSDKKSTDDTALFISILKSGISKALSHFYPLAGTVRDNLYIECNDQGLSFSEARVMGCDLSGLLSRPRFELFDHLFPSQEGNFDPSNSGDFQIYVQVNSFPCGAVAIGISLLHKVIDGTLISQFLKKWASLTRDVDYHHLTNSATRVPASSVFPRRETLPSNAGAWAGKRSMDGEKLCVERFVFDARAIASLRDESKSDSVPNPSAVEVLSGFIWKYMMKASKATSGRNKSAVLAHLVNLRQKVDPPLPEDAVGNVVWKAISSHRSSSPENCQPELPVLVGSLRKSFSDMKKDYVGKLTGEGGISEVTRWLDAVDGEYSDADVEAYAFISFCRMGFNELDFGRGMPLWVSPGPLHNAPFDRGVFLLDARMGKERELEAWVCMEREKMAILKRDAEFLGFASLNPSISI